jgi:hypothetical protein
MVGLLCVFPKAQRALMCIAIGVTDGVLRMNNFKIVVFTPVCLSDSTGVTDGFF